MNSVARPWYATNARDLLEHRRRNLKPVEPVIVSLVGGDFRDVAETVLYARRDMPVDRMDWRMLVDLDVWLWAGTGAAMDWISETAWRIAQARPDLSSRDSAIARSTSSSRSLPNQIAPSAGSKTALGAGSASGS